MKVGKATLDEVKRALEAYCADVEKTRLKPASKKTYLLHADNFVRWLADDFTPGARV